MTKEREHGYLYKSQHEPPTQSCPACGDSMSVDLILCKPCWNCLPRPIKEAYLEGPGAGYGAAENKRKILQWAEKRLQRRSTNHTTSITPK